MWVIDKYSDKYSKLRRRKQKLKVIMKEDLHLPITVTAELIKEKRLHSHLRAAYGKLTLNNESLVLNYYWDLWHPAHWIWAMLFAIAVTIWTAGWFLAGLLSFNFMIYIILLAYIIIGVVELIYSKKPKEPKEYRIENEEILSAKKKSNNGLLIKTINGSCLFSIQCLVPSRCKVWTKEEYIGRKKSNIVTEFLVEKITEMRDNARQSI
jgi:hypothetical protein